jgi:hypothetical protein
MMPALEARPRHPYRPHENEFHNLVRLAATILSPERLKLLLLALDGLAAKDGRK